jgi:Yqey-like protein
MSLSTTIMDEIKNAMRAKDTVALEALRAIKSEILLAQTATGSVAEITEADEIKILQQRHHFYRAKPSRLGQARVGTNRSNRKIPSSTTFRT